MCTSQETRTVSKIFSAPSRHGSGKESFGQVTYIPAAVDDINIMQPPMMIMFLALLCSNSLGHGFSVQHPSTNTRLQMSTTRRGGGGGTDDDDNDDSPKKLVLVTGGSRGIGRATCLLLASKGYQVAVNYKGNNEAALAVVNEIQAADGTATAFQADVSQEKEVEQLFDSVIEAFGMAPTHLVNNAGIMEPMEKDITKITKETLDADLATNTYGPFFCTREFVKRCSTKNGGKGGAIVNVSSISADGGSIVAYAMSKSAMEAMTAAICKTLPLEGIRINTVVPGLTDTGMAKPEQIEVLSNIIPMRRAGEPMEIAKAIEYLLSDASAYCTGAKLRVSGGL